MLSPLRMARRALKTPQFASDDAREDVKAAELKAERTLLERLEPLAPRAAGDPMQTLTAASTAWGAGAPAPGKALQRLADAVSGI